MRVLAAITDPMVAAHEGARISGRASELRRLRINSDPPKAELRVRLDPVAAAGRPCEGTTLGKLEAPRDETIAPRSGSPLISRTDG